MGGSRLAATRPGSHFSNSGSGRRDAKTDFFHGVLNISIAHEIAPHVASQEIFDTEQRDAYVYPHHIMIDPELLIFPVRVEGVGKTVATVNLVAVLAKHFPENR